MSAPAFALLGAGEFETWHDDIDRALLDGSNGDGSVFDLPRGVRARRGRGVRHVGGEGIGALRAARDLRPGVAASDA